MIKHFPVARGMAFLFLAATAGAAWPQNQLAPSSDPRHLYAFQDYIYCSADDGLKGRELWRVNLEGSKELVKDITLGSAGTDIYGFGAVGNLLYFGVNTPTSGGELWRTDGTALGTWRIKRFEVGLQHGYRSVCGELGGKIVISVQVYSEPALWLSDGTEAGTVPFVEEGADTPYTDFMGSAFVLGDSMYFGAELKEGGFGVYRSDGTHEGTVMLCKSVGLNDLWFSFDQKTVLFNCETRELGIEPWVTDGTPENTRLFLDINPGDANGGMSQLCPLRNGPVPTLAAFVSETQKSGQELWVTDGTAEGTRMLPEVIAGPGTASPGYLTGGKEWIYFSARVPEFGVELWRANPSTNIVERVSDINPGSADADPYAFCMLNGTTLFFSANSPDLGEELCSAPSDSRALRVVRDIASESKSSFPFYTTELNDMVVFAATDEAHGRELWVTDDYYHARLLADLYSDTSINPSSSPQELTAVGDILYFVADDIAHGSELWRSDGTPGGTRLLSDLFPGQPGSNPRELTAVDGWLYFTAENGFDDERLWQSDGTEAGTVVATLDLVSPQELTTFNGVLYCSAQDSNRRNGREIWKIVPGSHAGQVQDIAPNGESSDPHNLVVVGEHLYFTANDGVHGEELWRTDGSEQGTVMVRDIVEVPYEPVSAREVTEAGGRLFFAGETTSQGNELWSFDFGKRTIGPVLDIAQVDTLLLAKPTGEPGR